MRYDRLNQILQALRSWPAPVQARDLAAEFDVSDRSIYRDIGSLWAMGAQIDGAAGYGYTLIEDAALPPMQFSVDEVEALILGLGEVQAIGDAPLAKAAAHALSKLRASVPPDVVRQFDHSVLHARQMLPKPKAKVDTSLLRKAARQEVKIEINYRDAKGDATQRVVWPLGIVSMDHRLVLLGWCAMRQANRAFRLDRIEDLTVLSESFRPARVSMLRNYLAEIQVEIEAETFVPKPRPNRPS